MPIITVIIVYTAILVFFPVVKTISRYIPVIIGLFLSLIVLQIQRRIDWRSWVEVLSSQRNLYMVFLVAVIRIYGAMIEARLPDGKLLFDHMRVDLALIGVPESLFILLIPFVSGLAIGINVGTIGASFPVVMTMIGSKPSLSLLLPTTVLAYVAEFIGQLLSPVHVCLVVSNQYFKTSLLRSLRGLLVPVVIVLGGTYWFSFVLQRLLEG